MKYSDKSLSKAIILRADDYGVSPGTNHAIIDGIDCGAIQNVGVMACGPHLKDELDALLSRADQVAIGLHSAINSEWLAFRWGPVSNPSDVPSLVDSDGYFHPDTMTTSKTATVAHVIGEVQAQLNLVRELGLNPTYLDCHMGYNWIPGVHDALQQFCDDESLCFGNHPQFGRVQLGKSNDWTTQSPSTLFSQIAPNFEPCQVWIIHPAYCDPVSKLFGEDTAERRNREARLLIDPDFLSAAKRNGLSVGKYPSIA